MRRASPRLLTELDLLTALCCVLPEGPAICVAPPYSPFSALLELHGIPAADRLTRLPVSLLFNPLFAFEQSEFEILLAFQEGPSFIAGHDGSVVLPRGRLIRCERLDRVFDNLRVCSALEFNVTEALASTLRGGEELIRRCRPVIVAHTPSCVKSDVPAIVAFLAGLGYAFADAETCEVSDQAPHEGSFVLAVPISTQWSVADWRDALFGSSLSAPFARLAPRVASLRRRHLADPFAGWQAHVPASLMISDARLCARSEDGVALRWTGPRNDARILLFVPATGAYELAIDIVASVADEAHKPGLVRGGQAVARHADSNLGRHCLVVDVTVNDEELQFGCAISLVTPAVDMRMVDRRWAKVGVAISGFDLRRL